MVKEVSRLAGLNSVLSPSWRISNAGRAETHGVVVNTEGANEPALFPWTYAPSRVGKGWQLTSGAGSSRRKAKQSLEFVTADLLERRSAS